MGLVFSVAEDSIPELGEVGDEVPDINKVFPDDKGPSLLDYIATASIAKAVDAPVPLVPIKWT